LAGGGLIDLTSGEKNAGPARKVKNNEPPTQTAALKRPKNFRNPGMP